MKNDLDFDLSDIQVDNKTQAGLVNGLDDIITKLLDPLDTDKRPNDTMRQMVIYELMRDKETIKALLRCLRSTTKGQADKLEAAYQKYVEGAE